MSFEPEILSTATNFITNFFNEKEDVITNGDILKLYYEKHLSSDKVIQSYEKLLKLNIVNINDIFSTQEEIDKLESILKKKIYKKEEFKEDVSYVAEQFHKSISKEGEKYLKEINKGINGKKDEIKEEIKNKINIELENIKNKILISGLSTIQDTNYKDFLIKKLEEIEKYGLESLKNISNEILEKFPEMIDSFKDDTIEGLFELFNNIENVTEKTFETLLKQTDIKKIYDIVTNMNEYENDILSTIHNLKQIQKIQDLLLLGKDKEAELLKSNLEKENQLPYFQILLKTLNNKGELLFKINKINSIEEIFTDILNMKTIIQGVSSNGSSLVKPFSKILAKLVINDIIEDNYNVNTYSTSVNTIGEDYISLDKRIYDETLKMKFKGEVEEQIAVALFNSEMLQKKQERDFKNNYGNGLYNKTSKVFNILFKNITSIFKKTDKFIEETTETYKNKEEEYLELFNNMESEINENISIIKNPIKYINNFFEDKSKIFQKYYTKTTEDLTKKIVNDIETEYKKLNNTIDMLESDFKNQISRLKTLQEDIFVTIKQTNNLPEDIKSIITEIDIKNIEDVKKIIKIIQNGNYPKNIQDLLYKLEKINENIVKINENKNEMIEIVKTDVKVIENTLEELENKINENIDNVKEVYQEVQSEAEDTLNKIKNFEKTIKNKYFINTFKLFETTLNDYKNVKIIIKNFNIKDEFKKSKVYKTGKELKKQIEELFGDIGKLNKISDHNDYLDVVYKILNDYGIKNNIEEYINIIENRTIVKNYIIKEFNSKMDGVKKDNSYMIETLHDLIKEHLLPITPNANVFDLLNEFENIKSNNFKVEKNQLILLSKYNDTKYNDKYFENISTNKKDVDVFSSYLSNLNMKSSLNSKEEIYTFMKKSNEKIDGKYEDDSINENNLKKTFLYEVFDNTELHGKKNMILALNHIQNIDIVVSEKHQDSNLNSFDFLNNMSSMFDSLLKEEKINKSENTNFIKISDIKSQFLKTYSILKNKSLLDETFFSIEDKIAIRQHLILLEDTFKQLNKIYPNKLFSKNEKNYFNSLSNKTELNKEWLIDIINLNNEEIIPTSSFIQDRNIHTELISLIKKYPEKQEEFYKEMTLSSKRFLFERDDSKPTQYNKELKLNELENINFLYSKFKIHHSIKTNNHNEIQKIFNSLSTKQSIYEDSILGMNRNDFQIIIKTLPKINIKDKDISNRIIETLSVLQQIQKLLLKDDILLKDIVKHKIFENKNKTIYDKMTNKEVFNFFFISLTNDIEKIIKENNFEKDEDKIIFTTFLKKINYTIANNENSIEFKGEYIENNGFPIANIKDTFDDRIKTETKLFSELLLFSKDKRAVKSSIKVSLDELGYFNLIENNFNLKIKESQKQLDEIKKHFPEIEQTNLEGKSKINFQHSLSYSEKRAFNERIDDIKHHNKQYTVSNNIPSIKIKIN